MQTLRDGIKGLSWLHMVRIIYSMCYYHLLLSASRKPNNEQEMEIKYVSFSQNQGHWVLTRDGRVRLDISGFQVT